ncbi:hypothetical protein LshimejAT787_0310500 [Lyophyllum shimeji]|uniref:Uncharacterized protein n=1 Tax=Lyophyllum shimeji TaxID=47721 RepID=A0A9P3PIV3_LYOSH|nr:hypothetical protein LshimejAT787_0310500 [Lyophyllum shimeji]
MALTLPHGGQLDVGHKSSDKEHIHLRQQHWYRSWCVSALELRRNLHLRTDRVCWVPEVGIIGHRWSILFTGVYKP